MSMSAAGALLWMVHTLLRERGWHLQTCETDVSRLESFAGDVNLLPAQRYRLSKMSKTAGEDADVHVRALRVGDKLFVHFVFDAKSTQLRLKVSEFVKPSRQQTRQEEDRGRVLYTGEWRCNLEILRWRLERNLFPEFSSNHSLVASAAELSRLPEPLLTRVGGYLAAPDLCRLTRTSKYLNQLQDSFELWQQLLLRDYPRVHFGGDPKGSYKTRWAYQKRMEAWNQYGDERRLREFLIRQQAHWRWQGGRHLPAPPLHLPMPPPFLPLGQEPWSFRPPHRPGLLDDESSDFLPDPFTFHLNPVHSYFY